MDLVEVDIVGAEALQLVVDGVTQMLAADADLVRPLAHLEAELGRDDDIRALGIAEQALAHDRPAGAEIVGIGRVEEIDPDVEGALEERPALGLAERRPGAPPLGTPGIAAETDGAD